MGVRGGKSDLRRGGGGGGGPDQGTDDTVDKGWDPLNLREIAQAAADTVVAQVYGAMDGVRETVTYMADYATYCATQHPVLTGDWGNSFGYGANCSDHQGAFAGKQGNDTVQGAKATYDEVSTDIKEGKTNKLIGAGSVYTAKAVLTRKIGAGKTTLAAANAGPRLVSPPLTSPKAQLGKKWGRHASDYGLNPGDRAARDWFQNRVRDVHRNPDEVRRGPWNPKGGGGEGYLFFRQGEDLVVTKPDGQFVSMFPGTETAGSRMRRCSTDDVAGIYESRLSLHGGVPRHLLVASR